MCILNIKKEKELKHIITKRGKQHMSKFHFKLRELRNNQKISQQELANHLKISKSSINMYERGEREPGLDMLETIADFFNVSIDYLTGRTDNPEINR